MIEQNQIEFLIEQIAREFQPERIILFGSYASGTPQEVSDVDLLVVLPFEGKATLKALDIRNKVRPRIPVDLIVRSPQQIQDRLENHDWFIRDIVEKGRTLYEADNAGVGAES